MNDVLLKGNNDSCHLIKLARKFNLSFFVDNIMPFCSDDQVGTALMNFTVTDTKMKEIIDYVKEWPSGCCPCRILEVDNPSKGSYLLCVRLLKSCGCNAFAESGCFLRRTEFSPEGIFVHLISGGEGSLSRLIENLEEKGFSMSVVKKHSMDTDWELTPRQRNVLQRAYDEGYFDIPKKISLKDLADEMGVSPSSIDEILKRAKKKVLSHYLIR